MNKRPAIVPPTPEEDAAITSAAEADPDAQPLTEAQLAAMVPAGRWARGLSVPDLTEALPTISGRCQSLPDLDGRSVEEILGYDEKGAFENRRLAALERIQPFLDRPPVHFGGPLPSRKRD